MTKKYSEGMPSARRPGNMINQRLPDPILTTFPTGWGEKQQEAAWGGEGGQTRRERAWGWAQTG